MKNERLPLKVSLGIFLISFITLMVEMVLIPVFDVLLNPGLGYMAITCAMFSFALAGIYIMIKPLPEDADIFGFLFKIVLFFAFLSLFIRPLMNILPFNPDIFFTSRIQILAFLGMCFTLCLLFFSLGLATIVIFTKFSGKIQQLYFWSLTGAALGSVIYIPLLPYLGPGGIFICVSSLGFFTTAIFSNRRILLRLACSAGLIAFIIPFAYLPKIFDFIEYRAGRGVKFARESGKIEFSRWDPISRIDIIDISRDNVSRKHIVYDGGWQSSFFYKFDGNFIKLRQEFFSKTAEVITPSKFVSHYLKRDTHQKVLIIGSAGGAEVIAALAYGASEVEGVELVKTVVDLGKNRYAKYMGNIFNHPNVRIYVGEGRSFLRAKTDKYDIVQLHSVNTSSSIARGTGATYPLYLQTTEAYKEYFTHLKPEGILQINFSFPARMITTAALAWKELGKNDFQKHVVLIEQDNLVDQTLSTFLVKMSPWTEPEIDELKKLFLDTFQDKQFRISVDPLHPENNFLPSFFFSGDFPVKVAKKMDYYIVPPTDNKPYFSFIRKNLKLLKPNPATFLDKGTASILNVQLQDSKIPRSIRHLVITGFVSFGFCVIFIFLPLFFSRVGKEKWPGKKQVLVYFSCLGAGFIIFELTFIQIFMKLIGYPLYSYATVIFTFLFSAGIGSYYSSKLNYEKHNDLILTFPGIILFGLLLIIFKGYIFNFFLGFTLIIRIIGAMLMILPLGFFLGMPFPLGILAIQKQPKGAIAWAWGMNGLFTIIGGLLSIVFSIAWGFQITLIIALFIYSIAFLLYSKIRFSFRSVQKI